MAPVLSERSNAWRPWTLTSVTLMLFPQFHRPNRSGVLRLMLVWRLSLKSRRVSGTTLSRGIPTVSPGTRRVPLATWNCWSLLNVNPGDQVIQGVMFTADGVRLMVGKVWLTLAVERSWERVPPMLSAPHENRLSKFRLEPIRAVTSHGLSEFWAISVPFVE